MASDPYIHVQLDRLGRAERYGLKIDTRRDDETSETRRETHWLTITQDQLNAIRAILTDGK